MSRNQHVVPHGNQWGVRGAGTKRGSSLHTTQAETIQAGGGIARNQQSELLILNRHGQIRDRDSYGNEEGNGKKNRELLFDIWIPFGSAPRLWAGRSIQTSRPNASYALISIFLGFADSFFGMATSRRPFSTLALTLSLS